LQYCHQSLLFDPEQGKIIQGKYIFGKRTSIPKDELIFSLGGNELLAPKTIGKFDESTIIVIIITAVAIGAAVFYLKGYRK